MNATIVATGFVRPRCLPHGGGVECVNCGECRTRSIRAAAGTGDASETALKRAWILNTVNERGVRLQDEFGGDYESFVGYEEHRQRGHITIYGAKGYAVSPVTVASARGRKPAALVARDGATGLTGLDMEWADPSVRAEFGHDFECFAVFKRHDAAGDIRICGATRNAAAPATVASARGRKPLYTAEDWGNPAVRREFADDRRAFVAYCAADGRGLVNICQRKSQ